MAELALALPTRHKVRGFAKKRLLRRAVAPLLPRAIMHGKKQGFSIPVAAWLRGELEPFAREVLSAETIARQGYFRPGGGAAACSTTTWPGGEDLSRQIWGLMAFTLWVDRYAAVAEPAAACVGARESPRCDYGARTRGTRSSPSFSRARSPGCWSRRPRGFARRLGAIDEPNERGLHDVPTPKLGGLAILVAVARRGR